jgi:hypothetical protein
MLTENISGTAVRKSLLLLANGPATQFEGPQDLGVCTQPSPFRVFEFQQESAGA